MNERIRLRIQEQTEESRMRSSRLPMLMQVWLQLKIYVTRMFGLQNNLLMSFCRKLCQPQPYLLL